MAQHVSRTFPLVRNNPVAGRQCRTAAGLLLAVFAVTSTGSAVAGHAPGARNSGTPWTCPVSGATIDPANVPNIKPSAPITYITHTDANTGVTTHYQFTLYMPPPIAGWTPPRPVPPVAVLVHGGGWANGLPLTEEAAYIASLGYAAAPIQYRLTLDVHKHLVPANVFPAGLQDVRCAIRYVRANAKALGVDGTRIVVYGESAGGNLVAMAGTTADNEPSLDSADCQYVAPGAANPNDLPVVSAITQFVLDIYGVENLSNDNTYYPGSTTGPIWQQNVNLAKILLELFQISIPNGNKPPITSANIGNDNVVVAMTYFAADAAAELAYPDTQFALNGGTGGYAVPPFFIENGASDQAVPPNQSLMLFNELTGAANPAILPNGVPYANDYTNQEYWVAETANIQQATTAPATYVLLPGVDHGFDPFRFATQMHFGAIKYNLSAEVDGESELAIAQQTTCQFMDRLGATLDWYQP